jgi:hypothetical protein
MFEIETFKYSNVQIQVIAFSIEIASVKGSETVNTSFFEHLEQA